MIQIGNIYPTTKDGDVEVIGIVENTLTVKFINSGNIRNCIKCNLVKGMVSDKENRLLTSQKEKEDNITLATKLKEERLFTKNQAIAEAYKIKAAKIESKRLADETNSKLKVKKQFIRKFLKFWKISCIERNKKLAKEAKKVHKTKEDMYNTSVLKDFQDAYGNFCTAAWVDGRSIPTRSYAVWNTMKQRTTEGSSFQKRFKWYIGSRMSTEWSTSFQAFAKWYTSQQGYSLGWDIDKDALSDSKEYSEKTCVMLPREVNLLFSKKNQVFNLSDATKLDGIPRWRSIDGEYFIDEVIAKNYVTNLKISKILSLREKYKESIPELVFEKLLFVETSKLITPSAELPVLST